MDREIIQIPKPRSNELEKMHSNGAIHSSGAQCTHFAFINFLLKPILLF